MNLFDRLSSNLSKIFSLIYEVFRNILATITYNGPSFSWEDLGEGFSHKRCKAQFKFILAGIPVIGMHHKEEDLSVVHVKNSKEQCVIHGPFQGVELFWSNTKLFSHKHLCYHFRV